MCLRATFATACTFGLVLVGSGATAQTTHVHGRPDVAVNGPASPSVQRTLADSALEAGSGRISTTARNQIVMELAPEDTTPAKLFDLQGRTLVFRPDGHGGYSRAARPVAWEDDIGRAVADGEEVQLQSFLFDFAGRRWGSFFVSRRGAITFGQRLTYSAYAGENRSAPMSEVLSKFVTTPTIAPLYKPTLGGFHLDDSRAGTQHVSGSFDRVVITWIATDPVRYVHGVPVEPSRFQVVLHGDGSIRFNYQDDVFFGDGIVGLFPHNEEPTKGALIASIPGTTDTALPGHLDLVEVAIYKANTGGPAGNLIVEWTTRGPIPVPPAGTLYSYRLELDADEPYFDGRSSDEDFTWHVNLESDTSRTSGGGGGGGGDCRPARRIGSPCWWSTRPRAEAFFGSLRAHGPMCTNSTTTITSTVTYFPGYCSTSLLQQSPTSHTPTADTPEGSGRSFVTGALRISRRSRAASSTSSVTCSTSWSSTSSFLWTPRDLVCVEYTTSETSMLPAPASRRMVAPRLVAHGGSSPVIRSG